jgi:exonuclease 3'-5' domain-containing protein 1
MHRETGGSLWLQDPIPPELLAYAAHDIRAIATIYEHFLSVGWLPKSSRAALLAQSARYLDIHERPPASDNIFRRGPLLPLDILTEPALEKETCHGCVRQLSRGHFHVEPQDATRLAFCRVCEAAKLLAQKDEKRALGKTLTRPCELVEATAQT